MDASTFTPPSMLISIADWCIQAAFLLLILVHPWFLRAGQSSAAFGRPFFVGIIWGIWRMFYFDPITRNDIPGMGYIAAAFIAGFYALVFYAIRSVILWRRAIRHKSREAPNKTDASNGSNGIYRAINAPPSPSPDPRRSGKP
jgi:TRAP-type C4-dicarboxylate transport system permease small subunit